ncbi:hypothetical protein HRbin36_02599 [bacterium HR36]|nr:hypothetical protein HRbin36_02599 [bacterium HR36]
MTPIGETQRKLYRNACREAWLTVGVWVVSCLWTLGYCWLRGYPHEADSPLVQLGLASAQPEILPLRLGMPNWIFWGVCVPWLLCTGFTAISSFFLPDDPLDS